MRYTDNICNIWGAYLAEMGSLYSKVENVKYVIMCHNVKCLIDVFTKYAWVKPLKGKKGKTVINGFIEITNEFNRKPIKLWVDQGREFCNKSMQEWFNSNHILMHSTHHEG